MSLTRPDAEDAAEDAEAADVRIGGEPEPALVKQFARLARNS